jgi:2-deoxy-D-gluconate 3-dehydrogenase
MAATVQSLFSLSGRTAVVTGGTRGIGQAMAFALAEAGADIILIQRDQSNTATKDEIINRLGRKAHIHVAELSDRKAVKEIIPALVSQGFKPDILLNCAGIQRRHPSEKFPDEDWDEVRTTVLSIERPQDAKLLYAWPPFISHETSLISSTNRSSKSTSLKSSSSAASSAPTF